MVFNHSRTSPYCARAQKKSREYSEAARLASAAWCCATISSSTAASAFRWLFGNCDDLANGREPALGSVTLAVRDQAKQVARDLSKFDSSACGGFEDLVGMAGQAALEGPAAR
jgi:hypothetical protein